jgi:hypothetical protein
MLLPLLSRLIVGGLLRDKKMPAVAGPKQHLSIPVDGKDLPALAECQTPSGVSGRGSNPIAVFGVRVLAPLTITGLWYSFSGFQQADQRRQQRHLQL